MFRDRVEAKRRNPPPKNIVLNQLLSAYLLFQTRQKLGKKEKEKKRFPQSVSPYKQRSNGLFPRTATRSGWRRTKGRTRNKTPRGSREWRKGSRETEWGEVPRKSANYTDMPLLPDIYRPINMSLRGIIYRSRVPRFAAVYTLVCAPGTDAARLAIIEPSPATTQRQF